MTVIKHLLGIAVLPMIAGCGTTKIHEYTAHAKANVKSDDVSVLLVPRQILVYDIDGEGRYHPGYISAVAPNNGARIELLPGPHEATVVYNNTVSATKRSRLAFEVIAGRTYFVAPDLHRTGNREFITYSIHECGSDREKQINEERSSAVEEFSYVKTFTPICK